MIVKRFGCTAIHNKALYKCIIHSFIDSRKHRENIYSILSSAVISLGNYTVNKMRASGSRYYMLGIETAFKCTIAFYFHFHF